MPNPSKDSSIPRALSEQIAKAQDYVDLSQWYPAQYGTVPKFRVGRYWINVLWLIPLLGAFGVVLVAFCFDFYGIPAVQQFIARYPGYVDAPHGYNGFPLWLRVQHAINIVLMMLIIRSGIQILADHPRLYIDNNCTPGREWFRFQKPVPKDRVWTARDDAVTIPGWLGLPGIRHSIGLARWWHFACDFLWLVNGLIFYVLLFTTGQWMRLVPTSWEVFPNALSCVIQYASFHMPPENGWLRYNSLQQLAYFTTVFVAPPLVVLSGIMQSPAISNSTRWYGKILNRQIARTIHFAIMLWFVQFIAIHVVMVVITGFRRNLNHIMMGNDNPVAIGGSVVLALFLAFLTFLWFGVSPFTIKHARVVQQAGQFLVGWILKLMERWDPRTQYTEKDIAPYLWPNGKMPDSEEYNALLEGGFANYKLIVSGSVAKPAEFTLEDLKKLPKQEQITNHFCIQGWSGVAKWGGVRLTTIMDIVEPNAEAKFVVFYSFGEGHTGEFYWDSHAIENMRHELSIVAYELNGQPLPKLYGAPLRLRCENELGFKLVKWIRAIEFVPDLSSIGSGQGGYAEDHEFFAYRDPI